MNHDFPHLFLDFLIFGVHAWFKCTNDYFSLLNCLYISKPDQVDLGKSLRLSQPEAARPNASECPRFLRFPARE